MTDFIETNYELKLLFSYLFSRELKFSIPVGVDWALSKNLRNFS